MSVPVSIDSCRDIPFGPWELACTEPGAAAGPAADALTAASWQPASVPGTVAGTIDDPTVPIDRFDWWYRTTVEHDGAGPVTLRCTGLATIADVWFNGESVLSSENMFLEHEVTVSPRAGVNDLFIRFGSVDAWLKTRRPRGKWRTRLVAQQQLRWLRTSLLGRVSAWMPHAPPVGPWRPVTLVETDVSVAIREVQVVTAPDGSEGRVRVAAETPGDVFGARLVVGAERVELTANHTDTGTRLSGELVIATPNRWWPHTHGEPVRYPARVEIDVDGHQVSAVLPPIGFRTVDAVTDDDGFQIHVNGEPVFCRGACWTHLDPVTLVDDVEAIRTALELARDAGMNMVRVVGTGTYESDAFYEICDQLGMMVWQDFPFANMDYPGADEAFRETVTREARQHLSRLKNRPSLSVLCGGSEVFQQAAMLGLDETAWANPIFDEVLPNAVAEAGCPVPYVPSSPYGGSLPFHVGRGVAHYFGVGAYRLPVTDARRSDVRFTSECLGFSNVPEPSAVEALMRGGSGLVHTPVWKAAVPRDAGAGWDFEDVRDHYFREVFQLDPVAMRYSDPDRYLALSRVVTGEVMASAFAEWRRDGSNCNGGLVWLLRDFRLGAGWGVIDSRNEPKACYWFLRRTFAPIAVLLTDEGVDGLRAHVVNETCMDRSARMEVRLLRGSGTVLVASGVDVDLPGRSTVVADVDAVLGRFTDATWTYRFGPRGHDVVVVTVLDRDSGAVLSESFHFLTPMVEPAAQEFLSATAHPVENGYDITIETARVARAVAIEAPGWRLSDNYFNAGPGRPYVVRLRDGPDHGLRAYVHALNAEGPIKVRVGGA